MTSPIRQFDTGATRNTEAGKLDFEGFLSPLVLKRYAEYMDSHRKMPDGSLRDSDNWQRGIPLSVYIKSAWRHFFDLWREHRGISTPDGLENDACALLFNVSGYLHEHLKANAIAAKTVSVVDLYNEIQVCAEKRKSARDKWPPSTKVIEQALADESAYLSSFSPNGASLTTAEEIAKLREVLTDEELKGFGIGDVHPLQHVTLAERAPGDRL